MTLLGFLFAGFLTGCVSAEMSRDTAEEGRGDFLKYLSQVEQASPSWIRFRKSGLHIERQRARDEIARAAHRLGEARYEGWARLIALWDTPWSDYKYGARLQLSKGLFVEVSVKLHQDVIAIEEAIEDGRVRTKLQSDYTPHQELESCEVWVEVRCRMIVPEEGEVYDDSGPMYKGVPLDVEVKTDWERLRSGALLNYR